MKPVAAHRVGLTAARGGNMAADVVDPQHGWHILPDVLQGQELHLLVDVDGLRQAALLRGLVQQAVELGLHLGIRRAEFVAFVFAEIGADSCSVPVECRRPSMRCGAGISPPVWLMCVWHCSMTARRSAALETTLNVELDVDLIPGGLQELAEELPVGAPLTDPLELDRQLQALVLGHLVHQLLGGGGVVFQPVPLPQLRSINAIG